MKFFFIIATLAIIGCYGKSEADKIGDDNYEKFKASLSDKYNFMTSTYAEQVVIFSADSSKVKETRQWLLEYKNRLDSFDIKQKKEKEDNSLYLSKSFTVLKILESEPGCNRLTIRYLVKPLTKNKDSILTAMRIFTNNVFTSIPYRDGCSPLKCIVTIFETEKNFKINNWLVLGTRFSGEEPKITYRSELIEEFLH